jgi:hypothetical protein
MKKIFAIVIFSVISCNARANEDCEQPVTIVNIANLACVDENTGRVIHKKYQGNYKLDMFSDDEKNNWYRGDFYGLDND